MKKTLLFLAITFLAVANAFSQASFNTGAIGVDVNEYGKIELFNSGGIYQMWRTSILVGTSETAVFDYQNDAEQNEATALVENPLLSDFEIYGAYDNTYSELPPAVIVKLNAYGWNEGGFIIVKFNIMNNEESAMVALAGLDIIPYIDEVDGYDTVSFNSEKQVIRFHRGIETNTGIKLLSSTLASLVSFEYYDDYYVDSDYWNWMNYGSVQPQYPSSSDAGSVSITSQAAVELAPGESFDVYYAMALGTNEQEMMTNMAAADAKYVDLFVGIDETGLSGNEFSLAQNYPNPVRNTTTFSYQIPSEGPVSLKLYDATGNEVAVMVNAIQSAGTYSIPYKVENLAGGVYFYKLEFNGQVRTSKMTLIR